MAREAGPTMEVRSPPGSSDRPLIEPSSVRPSSSVPARGGRFGRFLVLGVLGSGGMGVVVEAHDEQLDRNVAIKLLHPMTARRHHARLLREAQALARLSHPNVVQVYEVGMVGEQMFIAMELVRGSTLAQWLRKPRDWRDVVERFLQAARGLAAAHGKDLVHRDFKPDNCILGEDGRVRVVDFGLVREVTATSPPEATLEDPLEPAPEAEPPEAEPPAPKHDSGFKQRLTRAGVVLGTLAYMSLEQLQGKPADARTDQYSFCASLYEALFGVLPYDAEFAGALLSAMIAGERSTPQDAKVPRRLRRALERGLQLDAQERWPSMDALIIELEASARRRRWWPATAMLGTGAALGGSLVLMRPEPDPCAAADPTAGGVWDATARQRLEDAFARHGPADADTLRPRITKVFDGYARSWGEMTRESCTATFTARRQSEALFELRTRCLERRRIRLEVAVDALASAKDTETLVGSSVLPFKLSRLSACADADALAREGPVVEEIDDHAQYQALLRHLDEADWLREIGRLDEALGVAEGVRERAVELEAPRLSAEALEHMGRILADRGPLRDAKAALEQAIVEASRAGDDPTTARAWLSLMFATTTRGTVAEAEQLSLGATAAVERVDDDLLRAWLHNNLGIVASESRDWALAERHLGEALELKSLALGEDHMDVGIAWFNLGMTFYSSGNHNQAIANLEQAESIFEATVGRSHFWTLYALSGLCSAEVGLRRYAAAVARCQGVIERFESSPVPPMWEGRTRFRMAEALWKSGRRKDARVMARQAQQAIASEDPAYARMIEEWLEDPTIDDTTDE